MSYRSSNSLNTFIEKKDIYLVKGELKRCGRCGSIIHGRSDGNDCRNCKKQDDLVLEVKAMAETVSK